MQERIQKILSRAGIASRRAAEQVMSDGRVTVNGETIRELGTKADVTTDDIRVDGVRIRPPADPVYLLLYKPRGVVTTRHDPEGRPTVMELVPPVAGLFPVGRLDVGTEGLLILTNDGNFAQRVSHPRYEVPRVYQAKVRDILSHETLARLTAGVRVEGERLAADHVRVLEAENNSWIELTLHEGKNHEVRRLMEAVGHPVSKLKRVAIGGVTLKGLNPGQFRHLTPQEIRGLTHGVRPAPRPATTRDREAGPSSRRPDAGRRPVPGPRIAKPSHPPRPHGRGFGSSSVPPTGAGSGTRPSAGTRPSVPRTFGSRPSGSRTSGSSGSRTSESRTSGSGSSGSRTSGTSGSASSGTSGSRTSGTRPFGADRSGARTPAGRPRFSPPGRGRDEGAGRGESGAARPNRRPRRPPR